MITITDSKLFDDLTEFDFEGIQYDLHNEFDCMKIIYSDDVKSFIFYFKPLVNSILNSIEIHFCSARLSDLNILFPLNGDSSTIMTFYRGRYEENNQLKDVSSEDERFFYLEFYTGIELNLFAKEVFIRIINSSTK